MRGRVSLPFTKASIEDCPLPDLEFVVEVLRGWLSREPIKTGYDYKGVRVILGCFEHEMSEIIAAESGDEQEPTA